MWWASSDKRSENGLEARKAKHALDATGEAAEQSERRKDILIGTATGEILPQGEA